MSNWIQSKKQLILYSVLFTAICYLFANGQRFTSLSYTGDSLLLIHQNDCAWEIAIGRFFQPILIMFRGGLVSPFLVSALSMIWVGLAVFFVVDYLEIQNKTSILFIAAIMSCNITVLVVNSAFLPYADFYMMALLFAVFGAWLIKKEKWLFVIAGVFFLSISMGTYQSYICVAIGLMMIRFIFMLLQKESFRNMVRSVIIQCVALVAGAALYYLFWKIFQKIFGIWTADTYNGLASMGDYSETSIFTVIKTTYENVLYYFTNPDIFVTVPFRGESLSIVWLYLLRMCNVLVVVLIIVGLIIGNLKGKTNWWQRAVQLLLLVMFPLGINFVCVLSKGMQHSLMIYGFYLVYILGIKTAEITTDNLGNKGNLKKYAIYVIMSTALLTVSWSNIVYSNQVYLKKNLQEKATHSMMTRIVYEIESTEGYESGVTPVAFLGSFEASDYVPNMEAFKDLLPYGMGKSSITYIGIEYSYLTYVLNTNMNLTRVSNEDPIIQEMPVYPAKGSIQMVDGVVVVKISE